MGTWATPVTSALLTCDNFYEAFDDGTNAIVIFPNPREICQFTFSIASEVGEVDNLDWQILGGNRIINNGASGTVVASPTFVDGDVDVGDDHVTFGAAHSLLTTGDGPFQLTTTGVLPAGLALATNYWLIVDSTVNISFGSTLANAMAGTEVTISGAAGTGTHTLNTGAVTIDVAAGDNEANDFYMGMHFLMTSGGELKDIREIADYVSSTDALTLLRALSGTPTAAETYDIFNMGEVDSGTITAETTLTEDLNQKALVAVSGYPCLIARARSTGSTDAHIALMTYTLDNVSA